MRRGFSLVELLVSTAIFSVVSIALVGLYATTADLVRMGESRRAAADSVIATLATLDDDLRRIAPAEAGGFFFCQSLPLGQPSGSLALAFLISDPDAVHQRSSGSALPGTNRLVLWMTNIDGVLLRRSDVAPANDRMGTITTWFTAGNVTTPPSDFQTIATSCLLFDVEIFPDQGRPDGLHLTEGTNPDPFPKALRATLAFAQARPGRLVKPLAQGIGEPVRFSGLTNLPNPALVRVGNPANGAEWLIATANGGTWTATKRGEFHTEDTTFNRGDPVVVAQPYTLTRSIGR